MIIFNVVTTKNNHAAEDGICMFNGYLEVSQ